MENNLRKVSKALLDLASVAETVLYRTAKARGAHNDASLGHTSRSLLERIDGFRSIEQVIALSGDLIGVHAELGKLMAAGFVTSSPARTETAPVVNARTAVATKPLGATAAASAPADELANAKQLLMLETKLVLGPGANKLRPRIEACVSIEQIYDLIVKVQEHLTTTGKADPGVFLDRLTTGLATARKAPGGKRVATQ